MSNDLLRWTLLYFLTLSNSNTPPAAPSSYPLSNGQAGRIVQIIKYIFSSCAGIIFTVLLSYITTPFPWCNLSSVEFRMEWRLQTTLPQQQIYFNSLGRILHHFEKKTETTENAKRSTSKDI